MEALAAGLLGDGLPTHRVEESLIRVANVLDVEVASLALPTAILVSCTSGADRQLFVVTPMHGGTDLGRLDRLHNLVGALERGEVDACEAAVQANELRKPGPLAFTLAGVASGLVALASAVLLGASGVDALVALAVGTCVGVALEGGRLVESARRAQMVFLPLVSTLLVAAAAHAGLVTHPVIVSLSAVVALLPGMTLTVSVVELSTGHWVSGTGRLVGGLASLLEVGFGILIGAELGGLALAHAEAVSPPGLAALILAASSLALGLALYLRVPRADLVPVIGISLATFAVFRVLAVTMGPLSASGGGAMFGALLAHFRARRFDRPTSVALVPAVAMLVPGMLALSGVSAVVVRNSTGAGEVASKLALVLTAMATGLGTATSLLPPRSAL